MMKKIIAYVQCNDQPGLISTISKSITESNGNIETSKMIKLESHFNMIILISINEKDQIKLEKKLDFLTKTYKSFFYRLDIPNEDLNIDSDPYFFQLKGADTEGLVHIFTDYLSNKNINIKNLETEIINAPITGCPLFLLKSTICIPRNLNIEAVNKDLDNLAEKTNVKIKLYIINN